MKVFFTFGGLPHYYNYVLNKLQQLPGVEITVLIPENKRRSLGKGVYESSSEIEFNIIYLKEKKSWYGKPYFRKLNEVIRKEKPDILITIWPYVLQFVFNRSLVRSINITGSCLVFKDIPFNLPKYHEAIKFYKNHIRNEQGIIKKRQGLGWTIYFMLLREVVKKFLLKMDAHVYYSEDAYEIIPTYGVDKSKIFITYNSPDTERLKIHKNKALASEHVFSTDKVRLLHVGRLVKWKRVDLLIEAFARIAKQYDYAELVIVGDGPEKADLLAKCASLNVSSKVHFTGAVYEPVQLGRIFMDCSIYVLAGMGGLSINEAMFYEKPVICSVADGTEKTLVRDGFNGYIFKEGDASDLYSKLDKLMRDPDQIKTFGKNSFKIIEEEINIYTVITGYEKAFKYCLNRAR